MAVATQEAEAATGTETAALDASAYLQQESRRFASLYETNAYVAYNLALRITGEERAARAATERAFMMRLGQSDAPAELVLAVAAAARGEARETPDASGAGAEEAQRMLAAVVSLPLVERVALGMVSVDHGTPSKIGAALDLPAERAGELRARAQQSFAQALGTTVTEAKAMCGRWPWAQPPPEIWEPLYTQAYRALERGLMTNGNGGPVATASTKSQETSLPLPVVRRSWRQVAATAARTIFVERSLASLFDGRPPWTKRAALAAAICLPAAIAAMVIFGGGGKQPPAFNPNGTGTPAGSAAAGGEKGGYKELTPRELDKLRLNELKQLKQYSQQQQNRSLSFDQRRSASERAARLAETARRRLAAARAEARRRAALRRRQRPRRQHAVKPPPPPAPTKPSGHKQPSGGGSSKPDYSQCLYDEKTGSYLCPT
jgi:hypothetical protein